jgi:hypothetical protein
VLEFTSMLLHTWLSAISPVHPGPGRYLSLSNQRQHRHVSTPPTGCRLVPDARKPQPLELMAENSSPEKKFRQCLSQYTKLLIRAVWVRLGKTIGL